MKKQFKGKICINRFQGDSSGISIEIEEGLSGVRFLRLEMTPETFGNAVTGLSYQDCDFELINIEKVGKKREIKTETVYFKYKNFKNRAQEAKEAVKDYEKDGWIAHLDDLGNYHKSAGENKYCVTFVRWV